MHDFEVIGGSNVTGPGVGLLCALMFALSTPPCVSTSEKINFDSLRFVSRRRKDESLVIGRHNAPHNKRLQCAEKRRKDLFRLRERRTRQFLTVVFTFRFFCGTNSKLHAITENKKRSNEMRMEIAAN